YITESYPKEDSREDDEDPEEDPADYPTDRDDDDEEEESFGDDADVDEEDKDEEEEHLALADYVPPSQTGISRYVTISITSTIRQMNEISSHQDLDNLFGPLYDQYYASSTSEVSNNSAAYTLDVEDIPSSSSIIVKDRDALQIVHSLEEP
nr:hypothetical protein [Tanacetum cinerariifolium]